MKNLDVLQKAREAIVQKMNEAINKNDTEAFQNAFVELCDNIQQNVLEEARGIVEATDQ